MISPPKMQSILYPLHLPVLSCIHSFIQHLFSDACHNSHLGNGVTRWPFRCSHLAVTHKQSLEVNTPTEMCNSGSMEEGRGYSFKGVRKRSLPQKGGTYKPSLGDKVSVCPAGKTEKNIPIHEGIMCNQNWEGLCSVWLELGSHAEPKSRPVANLG